MNRTNVAIVGAGYVADLYASTFKHHPELDLRGAYDINPNNLTKFCNYHATRAFHDIEELLEDPSIQIVLNLTNPQNHFEVSFRCLSAGKHVYSEKPLGMNLDQAAQLLALAKRHNVYLACAPCNLLSETAQTMWKAINGGAVGKIRLVYANFDDGMIAPNMAPWTWVNNCAVPWPAKDEFEVGCTYIHAGYVLTWLAAFFGPARAVTAFSSCQIPDKGILVDRMAPDFSVGCIEYDDGIVARVTCGLVAPRDKSFTVIGDRGVIYTNTVRDDAGSVYMQQIPSSGRWSGVERRINRVGTLLQRYSPVALGGISEWRIKKKLPFARKPTAIVVDASRPVDFLRGPVELAEAIRHGRPCRLSGELGLHIVELVEVLQYPERFSGKRTIESKFERIQPLTWT